MKDTQKKTKPALEWLVVVLFLCGVALIAVGLWQVNHPLALIFLGLGTLYLAACVSKIENTPERTDEK